MQNTIAAWCGALGLIMASPVVAKERQRGRSAAETRVRVGDPADNMGLSEFTPRRDLSWLSDQPGEPIALQTRLQLNEMIIRSSLTAYGGKPPPASPEQARKLLLAVPSHAPAVGHLTSVFGTRQSPFNGRLRPHHGIDIAAPHGSPIYAVADGVVVFAGWKGPLGRVVIVHHGFRITTKYAHAASVHVKRGRRVRRGEILGRVGNSGRSTGTHLHLEVRVSGRPIDPQKLMFELPSIESTLLALNTGQPADLALSHQSNIAELVTDDRDEAEASSLLSEVAAAADQLPPARPMSFGYDAIVATSWQQTEIPSAVGIGQGIGGESDIDGDEDESAAGGWVPESELMLLRDAARPMFPVNFGIVGGFSLLALVLAAGDHLPRWQARAWRRR